MPHWISNPCLKSQIVSSTSTTALPTRAICSGASSKEKPCECWEPHQTKQHIRLIKTNLQMHLQVMGYPKHLLSRCFSEAPFTERAHLLDDNIVPAAAWPAPPQPTVIIDFNFNVSKKDMIHALLQTCVPSPRIASKIGKNISYLIVRAQLSNHPPPASKSPMHPYTVTLSSSSAPCDIQGCRCCSIMSNNDQLKRHLLQATT